MIASNGKTEAADTLYRHWLILQMIRRREKISTTGIKDRLEVEHSISTTLRTIQRDLQRLSRSFPLVCDDHNPAGWSWQQDAKLFDLPGMDPQTAMAFRLVDTFLKHLVPRETLTAISKYFDHAESVLGRCSDNHPSSWTDKIRVLSRSELLTPPHIESSIADAIYDAIYQERRCRVVYQPKGNGPTKKYEINPLGLVFVDKVPYLVVTVEKSLNIRQMALHRFREVEILDQVVVTPTGFTLQNYIDSGGFNYPMGGEKIALKLRMDRDRAKHLEETPLAVDQVITPEDETTVILTATVQNSRQLRFWLNGLGSDLEVLEPIPLREELAFQTELLAKRYFSPKERVGIEPAEHTDEE